MGTPQRRSLTRAGIPRPRGAGRRTPRVRGRGRVRHGRRGRAAQPDRAERFLSAALGRPRYACGVYVSDMKLRVAHAAAYYYPDVIVSCEPASPETVFKEAPCFIAEVLSPSTAATDTREKLHAYRGIETLRYYVVVDSDRVVDRLPRARRRWRVARGEPRPGRASRGALRAGPGGADARLDLRGYRPRRSA